MISISKILGVSAVIYEKTDEALFFLLFRRSSNLKGWESLKGKCLPNETPDAAITRIVAERIKRFTLRGALTAKRAFKVGDDDHEFIVYLVESFTNIPVGMAEQKKKHDNYIWLSRSEALARLHWSEEKAVYAEAVTKINEEDSTV